MRSYAHWTGFWLISCLDQVGTNIGGLNKPLNLTSY